MPGRRTVIFQDKIPYSGTVSPGKKRRVPAHRRRGGAERKTGKIQRLWARVGRLRVRYLLAFFAGSSK